MPTFEIRLQDGRKIDIDAPDAQKAAKGAAAWAKANPAKPSAGKDAGKSLLTGLAEGTANLADTVMQTTPAGLALRAASEINKRTGNRFQIPDGKGDMGEVVSRFAHKPQTEVGRWARTAGQMAPNALAPGSIPARAANVFIPAVTTELSGRAAEALGADERGVELARAGGGIVGGALSSVRVRNPFQARTAATPVARAGVRARQDPAAMRARAAEYRDVGIQPTLADVVDDTGRGLIRAAANRPTPAKESANLFAEGRVENLPSRLSEQARATMSRDARTPDQIRAAEAARRGTRADQAFGAVRGDEITMAPETVQALRTDYGRQAITEAAKRERDPEVRAALLRLSGDALDNPSTPITIGMADRISRVLLGMARAERDPDLRATLTGLGQSIRGPARAASPGYGRALLDYEADSRLVSAADVGENLLTRNTDEFVAQAGALAPRERALALASGRRAIERASGENVAGAAGVARRLATAPEQQARNRALMGPERAERLQRGAQLEARAVRNAFDIAPRQGSNTFANFQNDDTLREAAGVGMDLARGRWGNLVGRAYDAWRARGMNDQQIEELVRIAIDPNQTDAAIEAIARQLDAGSAQQLLSLRNAALVGAISAGTAANQ